MNCSTFVSFETSTSGSQFTAPSCRWKRHCWARCTFVSSKHRLWVQCTLRRRWAHCTLVSFETETPGSLAFVLFVMRVLRFVLHTSALGSLHPRVIRHAGVSYGYTPCRSALHHVDFVDWCGLAVHLVVSPYGCRLVTGLSFGLHLAVLVVVWPFSLFLGHCCGRWVERWSVG